MSNYDGLMQKFLLEFIDSAGERKQLEVEDLSGKGLDHIDLPINFNSFSADDSSVAFPDMNYQDITEQEMSGCPAIDSVILRSEFSGIKANNGLIQRK